MESIDIADASRKDDTTSAAERVQTILNTLRRLDDEYEADLVSKEKTLLAVLEIVKADERSLRHAILQATTNPHQQALAKQQQQSAEATARLAQALLQVDDSDDDSGSSSSNESENP